MEPCIMHECAEERLRLGMLVGVGLGVTTYSQCSAPREELLDEVCIQVQVVEQIPGDSAQLGRTHPHALLEMFLWIRKVFAPYFGGAI